VFFFFLVQLVLLSRVGAKIAQKEDCGLLSAEERMPRNERVIAVARKLAVLLHKLWVSGEVYEPLRNNHKVVSAGGPLSTS
jgi:hypothetical protein